MFTPTKLGRIFAAYCEVQLACLHCDEWAELIEPCEVIRLIGRLRWLLAWWNINAPWCMLVRPGVVMGHQCASVGNTALDAGLFR